MIGRDEAQRHLTEFVELLENTSDREWNVVLGPDAWTLGEITGHLVDSAVNNHQRFVRLRFGDLEHFPAYAAEPWVEAQNYRDFDRATLISLWRALNELLVHIAFASPEEALAHCWKKEDGADSLSFLITDYYSHLKLHTDHYRTRLAEIRAAA